MLMVTQLYGFMAGGALTSITQVLSATSTATTITAPSGIQAGDLIVMADGSAGSFGTPADVVPTGFTGIETNTTGGSRLRCSYKLADGSEGGASITGMEAGGFGSTAKVIYVFRGNVAASTLTLSTPGNQGTTGNPSAQTISASGGVAPLVALGFYYCAENNFNGLVNPRTFTVGGSDAKDGELESNANPGGGAFSSDTWIAYKIYSSAPQDVSVDMDDEGDANNLMSCYIQMAN
jgi:hypothetical protein